MKDLTTLNHHRLMTQQVINVYGSFGDHENGLFTIPSPIDHADMSIVASVGGGWEHVSVSRKNRCPNWIEMEYAKRMFFEDDEVCMQLHVKPTNHINIHPHCLHIWKPIDQEIPLPPNIFVG